MSIQSGVFRRSALRLLVTSMLCSSLTPAFAIIHDDDNDNHPATRAVSVVIADDLKRAMKLPSFDEKVKLSLDEQVKLLPAVNLLWSKLKADQRTAKVIEADKGLQKQAVKMERIGLGHLNKWYGIQDKIVDRFEGFGYGCAVDLFNIMAQIPAEEQKHVLECALPLLKDGACHKSEVIVLLTQLSQIKNPQERALVCEIARPIWERLEKSCAFYAVHSVLTVKPERLEAITNFAFSFAGLHQDLIERRKAFFKLVDLVKDLSDEELVQLKNQYESKVTEMKENVSANQTTPQGTSQQTGSIASWLWSFWKR